MIVHFTFKTPDAVRFAIQNAVELDLCKLNLSKDEKNVICDMRVEELVEKAEQWFCFEEYVYLEWDTDTNQIKVMKQE